MLSPAPPNILGGLITELRDDEPTRTLVAKRVAGQVDAAGFAKGPGEYQAFIRLVILDAPPDPDVPVMFAKVAGSFYGVTPQNAWEVYWAAVRALHRAGPRLRANGLGIYQSLVVSGGDQGQDPDTHQPVVQAVIDLIASTQVIAS
jgi:hypothetical protein